MVEPAIDDLLAQSKFKQNPHEMILKKLSGIACERIDILGLSIVWECQICDKYFRKLPGQLGREIELGWQKLKKSLGLVIGPRIVYTYMIVREKCAQT